MQLTDLIYSLQPRKYVMRHCIFWGVWWVYIFFLYWYNQNMNGYDLKFIHLGHHLLIKSFFIILLQVIGFYAFFYYLMPYIIKLKWSKLILRIFYFSIFIVLTSYFLCHEVFPIVNSLFGDLVDQSNIPLVWTSLSIGLLNSPKIIGSAVSIKLLKYWRELNWEQEDLEKEKISTELQLLKAQVKPEFLFNTLNNIYDHALKGSPKTPEMLLKLSDLLSYILYECEDFLVPLEKEIEMMKEYIVLEKIRFHDNIEIQVNVRSKLTGKKIAPQLLLLFIEIGFAPHFTCIEHPWMNIDVSIIEDLFIFKLINGISLDLIDKEDFANEKMIAARKRLNLIYPARHELNVMIEEEMFVLILKIQMAQDL